MFHNFHLMKLVINVCESKLSIILKADPFEIEITYET